MDEINIKEIRERLGLTQSEFAKRVGVDPRSVQRWEAGATIPTSKRILFAKFLEGDSGGQTNVHGNNIKGNDVNVNYSGGESDMARLIDLLICKEQGLAKSQEQIDKLLEQHDRLISIIETSAGTGK